jgi:hypothetical protein
LISELPFFPWCAIGEGQACGFPGLSISITNQSFSSVCLVEKQQIQILFWPHRRSNKELKTNCEMVWAELTISNARKCQICAYPDDDISLEPLSQSLSRINPSSKSVIYHFFYVLPICCCSFFFLYVCFHLFNSRIFTLATKFVFFIFLFVFLHFCFYFISYPWQVLSMFKHFLRDVFCHWSVYLIF